LPAGVVAPRSHPALACTAIAKLLAVFSSVSPDHEFQNLPRNVGAYLRRYPAFPEGLTPVFFIYSKGYQMSADAKHLVTILAYKKIDYRNKKTGAPEQMLLAQCVVESQVEKDGKIVDSTMVGELLMPKALADTQPGKYLAEFELAVGQDLRIGSRLVKLHPHGATGRTPVQAKPAGAAA
jgi:hypothetical protein